MSVSKKISACLASVLLAVSLSLCPFSQAFAANTQTATNIGMALATVLTVLGIQVQTNADGSVDFLALHDQYNDFMNGLTADMIENARSSAYATNPDWVNNAQVWDDTGKQEMLSVFENAGEAGSMNLNLFSTKADDGSMTLLPFVFSLFMQAYLSSQIPVYEITDDIFPVPFKYTVAPVAAFSSTPALIFSYGNALYASYPYSSNNTYNFGISFQSAKPGYVTAFRSNSTTNQRVYILAADGWKYLSSKSAVETYDAGNLFADSGGSYGGINNTTAYFPSMLPFDEGSLQVGLNNLISSFNVTYYTPVTDPNQSISYDPKTDTWTGLTDNPDVNLGHNWWSDVGQEIKDVINQAGNAGVIGSDAVFDGDYIKDRGSIGVIGDYSGINSWADALSHTHAGVAEGVLDGTISSSTTATAANVATGELVTDTVGDLTKPNTGTSISFPAFFDGAIEAVTDKFPFLYIVAF